MVPDGEPELEPKGKLKRRIDATAPVIDLDHLDLDHLGLDHLGLDHLGLDHLGLDHLGFARSAVSQAHIGATAWGLDIDETRA